MNWVGSGFERLLFPLQLRFLPMQLRSTMPVAKATLLTLTIAILTGLMALPGAAQSAPTLLLNGRQDTAVSIGEATEVRVVGTPGAAFSLVWDVLPGPVSFAGHSIAIGGSPLMIVNYQGQVIPPSGVFTDLITLATMPWFQGIRFYAVAIEFNPLAPGGFMPSNGVSGAFVNPPDAGSDTAGFAGRPITLDGSGTRDSLSGQLQSGVALSWSIVGGPAGHDGVLSNTHIEFPSLTATVPGLYTLELSVDLPGTNGGAFDYVNINVYKLTNVTHPSGLFAPTPNIIFSCDLQGPAFNSFSAPGIATANGNHLGFLAPAAPDRTQFQLEVVAPTGQRISEGFTIFNNAGAMMNAPAPSSISVNMKQPAINDIANLLASMMVGYDLSTAVAGAPPFNIVYVPGLFGTATFSADVSLQEIRYTGVPQISLTPGSGNVIAAITLQNLELDFWVSGEIFAIPYSETATLNVGSATITVDGVVSLNNGLISSSVNNVNTSLSSVSLSPGGLITAFGSLFTSSITPTIESSMSTTIADIFPTLMDTYLNDLPSELDLLLTAGIDGALDFEIEALTFSPGSFRIDLAGGAHSYQVAPNAPSYTRYFSTPTGYPTLAATSPNGSSYDFALAVSDDALNQAGPAILETGLLNVAFTGQLDLMGQPMDMNAGSMVFLFPGVGFEKFDPAAIVYLNVKPTSPPFALLGSPTGELGQVFVSDLEVSITVEVAAGVEVPVLTVGLNGAVGMDIILDLGLPTIEMVAGTTMGSAYAISTMPGVDATPVTLGLGQLLGLIVPSMMATIGPIPVPDLTGVGVGTNLIELVQQGDHAVIYTN